MPDLSYLQAITIRLMDPARFILQTRGEVTSSRTYNALTMEPERHGLFCPTIFGPTMSWQCRCGRIRNEHSMKGFKCPKCNVEINDSIVRRRNFGHISLASPVVHIWFREAIALLLNIPPRKLDGIINCTKYVITDAGSTDYKLHQIIEPGEHFRNTASRNGSFSYYSAHTGGRVIQEMLKKIDIDELYHSLRKAAPSRRVSRRLFVVRDFYQSKIKPEWMVIDVLPVLPADLRPILFLDNGTVVSSDLNDLYLRIINRNKRLGRLYRLEAPEVFINAEKRLLQAAVDSLFENGRKTLAKDRSGKKVLKSLTDVLKGKEGRLRRNLLGKRVDYSARSVIVAGPELKIHQCGLPVDLAMDMVKPFVYHRLLRAGYAVSLQNAQKIVEMRRDEAMEALEQELDERVVLLNRAPSLHRMSIQAFDPVLVEGRAIRLHPLTCAAFNADFDGDQMGVHLPLTVEAQIEARVLMQSVNNIFSPANGKLSMAPAQDIVLGIYYLTKERSGEKGEGMIFSGKTEAVLAHDMGAVALHARIKVRVDGKIHESTPGRVIFSEAVRDWIPFSHVNKLMKKKDVSQMIEECFEISGPPGVILLLDKIKEIGFKYATLSGISLSINDICIPKEKKEMIEETEREIGQIMESFNAGEITEEEKHNRVISLWMKASKDIADKMMENYGTTGDEGLSPQEKQELKKFNSVYMMADSGARGSIAQITQVAGMRGLMAKPTGEIVEIPIKSNFKEGLSYFEYLLSTHGARKGRADGALKTANAGYFTRRLVDVAHDIVIERRDCGTEEGIWMAALFDDSEEEVISLRERISGRITAEPLVHPLSGEILAERDSEITEEVAQRVCDAGVAEVYVRSPFACGLERGICARCYGRDLSRRREVEIGEAVGIIAAQSIGEPGTQLTLRTFHTGGSASSSTATASITAKAGGTIDFSGMATVRNRSGKLVVINRNATVTITEEGVDKYRKRVPYGSTLTVEEGAEVKAGEKICEWDPFTMPIVATKCGTVRYDGILEGVTVQIESDETSGITWKKVSKVTKRYVPKLIEEESEYVLPIGALIAVNDGDDVHAGDVIARVPKAAARNVDITGGLPRVLQLLEVKSLKDPAFLADLDGIVTIYPQENKHVRITIDGEFGISREHLIPVERQVNVYNGDSVTAGDTLVDGVVDIRDVERIFGREKAAMHIINEVQKVYRSQGVSIADKHLEVIVRKMFSMVEIVDPGDTHFIKGEMVQRRRSFSVNEQTEGRKARAAQKVVGLTHAALYSESWLSAASFQNTTSVLARSAIQGKTDPLAGVKENVLVGNLIPVGTAHPKQRKTAIKKKRVQKEKEDDRAQRFLMEELKKFRRRTNTDMQSSFLRLDKL